MCTWLRWHDESEKWALLWFIMIEGLKEILIHDGNAGGAYPDKAMPMGCSNSLVVADHLYSKI